MIISVDAMGGDEGPEMVIPGLNLLLVRQPELTFLLFGEEDKVAPTLANYPKVKAASEIRHCDITIAMDEKPSQALRSGRGKSSLSLIHI